MYGEQTVIYADVLFCLNFTVDYLCLFVTARLLGRRAKALRLCLASAAGGVYAFIPYTLTLPTVVFTVLHLLAAGGIAYIAFGKSDIKRFFIGCGVFTATSATLGGIIGAIQGLTSDYGGVAYAESDALSFVLIAAVSAVIALCYGMICRARAGVRSARVRITQSGITVELSLLADSGNLVTEPFSALPVIIVASSALPFPLDSPESESFPAAVRAIPFRTGAGSGCHLGFRPDKAELLRIGREPRSLNAYIGIDIVTREFSGYDGLIPTSLL